MTTYRADLTGEHHRLIAHLLPGDRLILTWTPGEQIIDGEAESPWIEIFNDDPIPRICRYGSEARLTQNTRVRQRPPRHALDPQRRSEGTAVTVPQHAISLYVEHPNGGTWYRTRCTCGKYLSKLHGSGPG